MSVTTSTNDINEWFEIAHKISVEAGKMILEAFNKSKTVECKSSSIDLVTETDTSVEKFLIGGLRKAFPTHKFIGEESVAAGAKCELSDEPTWIIDPVDGTMNFVHSLPYTAVSVALWILKEPIIGIVYNPILDRLYSAKKGQGAFLNSKKISVSGQKDLSKGLIMSEMGYRNNPVRMEVVHHNLQSLIPKVHGLRCLGSAALHICHVAEGAADASVSLELYPWDKAAGVLIVQEAGGVIIDNSGSAHDVMAKRVICASSSELAKDLVQLLKYY